MKLLRSAAFQVSAVCLLAAAWKSVFFFWEVVPFNADEAVVALMARHILMGERPVFFYGQAYMGSLDAFLVAAGFLLFGQYVWVIRLVQLFLYILTLLVIVLIGKEAFGSWHTGALAALLLAIPTVNVTLYTTASLGGYGEALLTGSLCLLLALRIVHRFSQPDNPPAPWLAFCLWGVLAGCGLWANGLSLVFSAPAGLYILWGMLRFRRSGQLPAFFMAAGAGFFIGSLPWWVYAAANGPDQLLLELFGTAVAVEKQPWLARTASHLINFLLLGTTALFGFRPPWSVRWLAQPLIPLVLVFWLGVIVFWSRRLARVSVQRGEYGLLAGVVAVLLAGFLFTPFGVDPSGRYFVPLAVPFALAAAQMILHVSRRTWQAAALVVLVLGFQLWGTVQCGLAFPPGLTTQFYEPTIVDHRADPALIDFLLAEGETRGYSTYWVAYPLAFQSAEELIFAPRLPYHLDLRYTPRDDRYAPYTASVAASQRVAYITARNPALDAFLRSHFQSLGIGWQEKKIGDYRVYFRLSRPVRPEEMGLGVTRE